MDENKLKLLLLKDARYEFSRFLDTATNLDAGNLLRIICSTDNIKEDTRCEFASKLLEKYNAHEGESPSPVYLAAEKGLLKLLATLINHPTHPATSELFNSLGESAVNATIRGAVSRANKDPSSAEAALKCVKFLAEKNYSLGARDNVFNKFTPVHLAAVNGLWDLVQFFLDRKVNIDIRIGDKTARELIEVTHPEWIKDYVGDSEKGEDDRDEMVSSLKCSKSRNDKEKLFSTWLKENELNLRVNESCKGGYTLLQYAVMHKLPGMIQELIKRKADPNSALLDALESGEEYFNLLRASDMELNLRQKVRGKLLHNVLHVAVLSLNYSIRVIEDLLEEAKFQQIDSAAWINERDHNGCTALHLAAKRHLKDAVALLLHHKASLFIKDNFDLPAFYYIRPELIEEHLDEQIELTEPLTANYGIVFDLDFLQAYPGRKIKCEGEEHKNNKESYQSVPKEDAKSEIIDESIHPEMESLKMMSKSPIHCRLLQHPVIRAFLQLKWQRLHWFYWFNCIFYLIFAISFFAFVFSINLKELNNENKLTNSSDTGNDASLYYAHHHLFQIITAVMTFFLTLRELSQALFLTEKYFFNWENWLEVVIILLTFLLLIAPFSKALASALSLLICLEMFLLMSRYPRLANYIHMFLQVARNFVKFLSWYFLMILAFGFSFYIIFPFCHVGKDCKTFFNTVPTSIFKTVVMISGEFESGDIEFDHVSVASHLIFIAFLFLISIVMINLLNGLAVSDTQQIKNDAELIFCKSQTKFFDDIESTLLMTYREGDRCPTFLKSLARWMSKKIMLIDNLLAESNNKVTVLLYKNNDVKPDVRLFGGYDIFNLCGCKMIPSGLCTICNTFNTIIRDALQVVNKNEERREALLQFKKNEERKEDIPARLQRLEELIRYQQMR
ncbi:transient receptor potential cation channel protein painless-like [Cloeon dipterum]|uniref:transient receptor potential cation channel protein painless-like n=1 Tax=Cloeon dipterum TaxID=197152 RepID=UPI00321FBD2E